MLGPSELTWCPPAPTQLYDSALTENQKLKTKLQEAQLELADVKCRLEKMAQVRARGDRGRAEGARNRGGAGVAPQWSGNCDG